MNTAEISYFAQGLGRKRKTKCHERCLDVYGSSDSTKSPASSTATVGEPKLMSQVGESVESRVHVSAIGAVEVPVFRARMTHR